MQFTLKDLELIKFEDLLRQYVRDKGTWIRADQAQFAADAIAELLARREREEHREEKLLSAVDTARRRGNEVDRLRAALERIAEAKPLKDIASLHAAGIAYEDLRDVARVTLAGADDPAAREAATAPTAMWAPLSRHASRLLLASISDFAHGTLVGTYNTDTPEADEKVRSALAQIADEARMATAREAEQNRRYMEELNRP